MEQERERTEVMFRKDRDGTVFAVFPHDPADVAGRYVTTYEHVGQHGSGDYGPMIATTRPATEEEYRDLRAELERIGYDVRVIRRRSRRR